MIYRLQLKLILQSTYWCGRDACYRHPPETYNVQGLQAHPWSRNMSLSNWVTASVQIERGGGGLLITGLTANASVRIEA